jgi:hypothetical protein
MINIPLLVVTMTFEGLFKDICFYYSTLEEYIVKNDGI